MINTHGKKKCKAANPGSEAYSPFVSSRLVEDCSPPVLLMLVDKVGSEAVLLKERSPTNAALPGIIVVMETHVHEVQRVLKEQNITVNTVERLFGLQGARMRDGAADWLDASAVIALTADLGGAVRVGKGGLEPRHFSRHRTWVGT